MTDIDELKQAFDDIVWMAIRYAHNRHSYAPGMVRDACKVRAKFGNFGLKEDDTLGDPCTHRAHITSDDLRDLFITYKILYCAKCGARCEGYYDMHCTLSHRGATSQCSDHVDKLICMECWRKSND